MPRWTSGLHHTQHGGALRSRLALGACVADVTPADLMPSTQKPALGSADGKLPCRCTTWLRCARPADAAQEVQEEGVVVKGLSSLWVSITLQQGLPQLQAS